MTVSLPERASSLAAQLVAALDAGLIPSLPEVITSPVRLRVVQARLGEGLRPPVQPAPIDLQPIVDVAITAAAGGSTGERRVLELVDEALAAHTEAERAYEQARSRYDLLASVRASAMARDPNLKPMAPALIRDAIAPGRDTITARMGPLLESLSRVAWATTDSSAALAMILDDPKLRAAWTELDEHMTAYNRLSGLHRSLLDLSQTLPTVERGWLPWVQVRDPETAWPTVGRERADSTLNPVPTSPKMRLIWWTAGGSTFWTPTARQIADAVAAADSPPLGELPPLTPINLRAGASAGDVARLAAGARTTLARSGGPR